MKDSLRRLYIRVSHWEFWPLWIVYLPLYFYWLLLSARSGSFFYFTASNPGLENSGMLGESKIRILDSIPAWKAKSLLIDPGSSPELIERIMDNNGLTYPVIMKPDIGERGWGVRLIQDRRDAESYLRWAEMPFILQEYVDLDIEAGVFYYRYPGEEKGTISSIALKEMLTVTGNGYSTLGELIHNNNRAFLQLKRLSATPIDLHRIPGKNEEVLLNPIGNHSLGTKFIDGSYLITPTMEQKFDEIASSIEGFYYGRFDLRAATLDDLKNGEVIIMELNGSGSEPAHIYEPGYSFWKAQKVLLRHWKILYTISRENHRKGVPYMSLSEGLAEIRNLRQYNRRYRRD